MTIYEIDQRLTSLVDEETGEIMDYDAFESISMDRDKKIEGMINWYKDLSADAMKIREESRKLRDRQSALEKKAARLQEYIQKALNGNTFQTATCEVKYRKSKSVELEDNFVEWAIANNDSLLKYKAPEPDKTAIKDALQNGAEIPGAMLVEKSNIQIK